MLILGRSESMQKLKAQIQMRYRAGGEVRVKADSPNGEWKLEVLGVPYGGHVPTLDGSRDADGETFSDGTDLWLEIGERRPVAYYHGMTPEGTPDEHPEAIGVAEFVRRDARGGWFEVTLDRASKWAARVWLAALAGTAHASSGALGHLVRVGMGGLIDVWPLGELSVFDAGGGRQPANRLATVIPLKALFDAAGLPMPEAFAEAHNAKAGAKSGSDGAEFRSEEMTVGNDKKVGNQPVIDVDALADAVLDRIEQGAVEQARVPAWRGGFATKRVTGRGFSEDAMKSFRYWIATGDEGAVKAALQEGTDAEGGYLVPDDFYAQVVAKRDDLAIAREAGATVIQTSLALVNVPVEDSEQNTFAITAEEAAVDEDEPTFGQVAITVYKFTKLVKISEELASDQAANLDEFLANSFARKMALTENNYHLVGTGSGEPQGVFVGGTAAVTLASASTIAASEVIDLYYKLSQPYRTNAAWAMNDSTEAVLRGLQGNPFLFGVTPAGGPFEVDTLMDKRVFNSDSAAAIAASAKSLLIGDWSYYMIAERQGLVVQRLDELYAANGQIGLLAKFRQGAAVGQAEAFQYATQAAS
jgi:HK97 family phage major capsid protein